MTYSEPAFDELRELLIAALAGRLPGYSWSQRSDPYKMASVYALGAADCHHGIYQVGLDVMPDTCEDDMLSRYMTIYGVPRRGATAAGGDSALRVFGTVGVAVVAGWQLLHVSGIIFEIAVGGNIGAGGFLDCDVDAVSLGAQTNLEVGEELQFSVVHAGIENNAQILVGLAGGQDSENDDSGHARLNNRIQYPALGGARNDYEQWALASAAYVASAYCYPNRNGLGTVDVAALKSGSGTARSLTVGERTDVQTYLDAHRPVSATVRVLETTDDAVDVEVTILPESDPAYVWDWDDTTPPVVAAWTPATRLLQFAAARPIDMDVGDRIVIESAGGTGVPCVIEALDESGPGLNDEVILVAAPAVAPAAPDNVYAGGPLTVPVRDAIVAVFDALGPANPDGVGYGPWQGNLRLSQLFEAIQTTTGVLDSTIIAPGANVAADDPAWPLNTTVEYLIPGLIIVRGQ